jgi:hypothetical protein
MTMNALLDIVLKEWIPPLVSVLLGGLIASILVPRWQVKFEKGRLYDRRKLELLEQISETFPRYVVNWNRLIYISLHEAKKGNLSQDEILRKQRFIDDRNSTRDALVSALNASRIYFSSNTEQLIEEFYHWDDQCSIMRVGELPKIDAWWTWERKLLSAMKNELEVAVK